MSLDQPTFTPRFPWYGGDLQTLANRFRSPALLSPHASQRMSFALNDGTGDTLQATLDTPAQPRTGRPLAILIHGLTGSEDSAYILSQAKTLLDHGIRVLRLNLRGAGLSRASCGGQYYAGRSQDFRALLTVLPKGLGQGGVVAIGYSLGGAMLLKYLGEEGAATPLAAAATVSAPIDLSAACRYMLRPRNWLYHRYILGQMKREATGQGASLSPDQRRSILASRTIWQYDDDFIAPRHGFAGAEDYYERCKPLRFMGGIRIPTLVVAALDDPWIPGRLYAGYDWAGSPALRPLLPGYGGHVGFHGTSGSRPWSDTAIMRFFDHVRDT